MPKGLLFILTGKNPCLIVRSIDPSAIWISNKVIAAIGWGNKDKSLDNLSDRLDRVEDESGGEVKPVEDNDVNDRPYATAQELEQVSSMERYIAWFNWHVREIMPYYKAEVMRLHSITSDEIEFSIYSKN